VGLFSRSGGAVVTVTPEVVRPRQTVTATVTTDKPIDKVRSARLDWGYTNFYNYHWAGRVDSAAAAGNDSIWTADQVGTNYGGDRDTDDWVSVIVEDVPIATGEFTGTSTTFKIPSWAPASSSVYLAGETITGQATLTPTMDLPDGDLAVSWQRERESHPLTRAPGPGGQLDGRIVPLGKRIPLRAGVPVVLPFEIPLPADAPPTAAAVHSSINWFVQARMFYSGFNAHQLERVRRSIVVVNAP